MYSSFVVSAILVNYPQQLFNDALYSYEQAISLDNNTVPFQYWKFCTWSIVTSTMTMESYVTDYLRFLKNEIGQLEWGIYEREAIAQSGNNKGIFSKVRLVELITDSVIIDDNDPDWLNIKNTIKLRNDLVHYNDSSIFNQITDINADKSIKACRSLIKKFLTSLDIDYTISAKWIDKIRSETYDR